MRPRADEGATGARRVNDLEFPERCPFWDAAALAGLAATVVGKRSSRTLRRGGQIRTADLTDPNRARYQTALRPEASSDGAGGCAANLALSSQSKVICDTAGPDPVGPAGLRPHRLDDSQSPLLARARS